MDVNTTKPPKDSYFSGNAEWELLNVTVRATKFMEDGEERVEVHYIIHLRRRPVYYITVIVAPTFLISALSILGIFTPGTNDGPRGEKVERLIKIQTIFPLGIPRTWLTPSHVCASGHSFGSDA
uniref:Neur_chan_memb domain-containing protein n=1 Tax=Meloidogyne floridensis TaxID=298350 RepID=A0A915NYH6_9BILA